MAREVGIYKRNQKRKKVRKHTLDRESKIQEKTITIKKKEGKKWKTPVSNIFISRIVK